MWGEGNALLLPEGMGLQARNWRGRSKRDDISLKNTNVGIATILFEVGYKKMTWKREVRGERGGGILNEKRARATRTPPLPTFSHFQFHTALTLFRFDELG